MTVFHDDILLPHWNQLADALQLSTYSDAPISIEISHVELDPQVLDLLESALTTKSFSHLTLDGNEFHGHTGIEFAINVIKNSWNLKIFRWRNNSVNCITSGIKLANTILNHSSLYAIQIDRFFDGGTEDDVNGYHMLSRLLSVSEWENTVNGELYSDLIAFTDNNVRTLGRTCISDFIAANLPLGSLNLSNNYLNDIDADLIAESLRVNTKLKSINLGGNHITSVGIDALKRAIFNTSSLKTIDVDSNHMCSIKGIGIEPSLINNLSNGKTVNRDRKIYSLLSTRCHEGSNASHLDKEFGEDGLKYAPKVLSFISGYQMHATPLAIMYDTLRNWRMPELYEYQRAPRKPSSIIFVRNIPTECSDSKLSALFSRRTGFKEFTTVGEGYASIEFETESCATFAYQQMKGYKESTWSSALNLTFY